MIKIEYHSCHSGARIINYYHWKIYINYRMSLKIPDNRLDHQFLLIQLQVLVDYVAAASTFVRVL